MAVRTYSGRWTEQQYQAQTEALLEALRVDGLEPAGKPILARYDPPSCLGFFDATK
ncbi:MAG: hypothetical protein HOM68_26775 [Gemmatimonadetes bacterium]|nr:hypothetical protein [Gemmatimonadota bacterium]MBT4610189.1 hypothetical protein [Gemmatimonadota bacterium]MBT5060175.1 hypothetical protein [Gemmatimonadota bacterium]MBT5146480.1 hypothetical protein [Gemmatimonadota bacterium]MBT5591401.1 hypothetical protein [Gemmatimonadota bacterium]